eukprot:gene7329-10889_t
MTFLGIRGYFADGLVHDKLQQVIGQEVQVKAAAGLGLVQPAMLAAPQCSSFYTAYSYRAFPPYKSGAVTAAFAEL